MIEPLDPGKVAAIHVEAGQSVKAGDLLIELDTAEASADALAAENALNASLAETVRRRFAIDAVRNAAEEEALVEGGLSAKATRTADGAAEERTTTWPSAVEALSERLAFSIAWDKGLPETFRLREEAVLRADFTQLQ